MIHSLSFENYKAFANDRIKIKPLTVLLGANSVGKSAIVQLFLLLQQTNKASNRSYRSALKLYGGSINLGDTKNIFRRQDTNAPLKLSFEIKSSDAQEYLIDELISEFKTPFYEIGRYISSYKKTNESLLEDFYNKKSKQEFNEFIENLILEANELPNGIENSRMIRNIFRHSFGRPNVDINIFSEENLKEIISTNEFLVSLSEAIKDDLFKLEFEISHSRDRLLITKMGLINGNIKLVSLSFDNTRKKDSLALESDIYNFKDLPESFFFELFKSFSPVNTIFQAVNYNRYIYNDPNFFSSVLARVFMFFQNRIGESFEEDHINYVSPLRAHPKRYYMLDKAKLNISLDTLDGDALTEILKENREVRDQVNKWLQNFGLNVNVETLREVIHKLKVEQNELSLDITDVGFGISQILPVIIQGFLSLDDSLTIIEQPEIHLHPKMQADLADLFIDMINSGNKNLLIETHSEYFLKRLRRRIAEKRIDYNDVIIYLIESDGEKSSIRDLDLQPGGAFKYPKDYYGGELLKDATEFIKLSASK